MVIAAVLGGGLSSCASSAKKKAEELAKANQPPPLYAWDDTVTVTGPTAIRIELSEQKAYIYRGANAQPTAWTYLASGTSSHRTPTGTFWVMEKQADKSSNRYGVVVNSAGNVVNWDAKAGRSHVPAGGRFVGAPMPYWMRLTGYGIGMHAGQIPVPGKPASHGCIRLPAELAAKLFDVVDVGTKVTIAGQAP